MELAGKINAVGRPINTQPRIEKGVSDQARRLSRKQRGVERVSEEKEKQHHVTRQKTN